MPTSLVVAKKNIRPNGSTVRDRDENRQKSVWKRSGQGRGFDYQKGIAQPAGSRKGREGLARIVSSEGEGHQSITIDYTRKGTTRTSEHAQGRAERRSLRVARLERFSRQRKEDRCPNLHFMEEGASTLSIGQRILWWMESVLQIAVVPSKGELFFSPGKIGGAQRAAITAEKPGQRTSHIWGCRGFLVHNSPLF